MSYQDPPHFFISVEDEKERMAKHNKWSDAFKKLFPPKAISEGSELGVNAQEELTKMEAAIKEKMKGADI